MIIELTDEQEKYLREINIPKSPADMKWAEITGTIRTKFPTIAHVKNKDLYDTAVALQAKPPADVVITFELTKEEYENSKEHLEHLLKAHGLIGNIHHRRDTGIR